MGASSNGKWTTKSTLWEVYFGLIVLFVNLAQTEFEEGKPLLGNYGGYPTAPYQILGIIVAFTIVLFLGGVIFPNLYAPLALPQTAEAKAELQKYETGTNSAVSEENMEQEKKLEVSESMEKNA